jgi:glutamyl-tRNA synthetase
MTDSKKTTVRVRMAPSPTGPLHVGSARTALFNWLFARQNGGVFILRIEDTDKERSKKEYEDEILQGFTWLGLNWDEGPYRQSERGGNYKKYLEKLLEKGEAYYCYCTKEDLEAQREVMASQGLPPKYNGHCRNLKTPPAGKAPGVIRFKVPEINVEFKDMIRGKVSFDASLFGDIVIAKDIDTPLYNFAVVVDDEEMNITHVIRGEDHISNTPKQLLMQRALGFNEPIYAHIPLILNPNRSKMSKRFADTAVDEYKRKGYLPEAMVNFLALLGWHPKDDREIFSLDNLIEVFDLTRVQQAGAAFNQDKLDWLNREYLKKMNDQEIAKDLKTLHPEAESELLVKLVAVERSRANTLNDFLEKGDFFFKLPKYDAELLIWKGASKAETITALEAASRELTKLSEGQFEREAITRAVTHSIGEQNRGVVLWPLRVSLSGLRASPDPIDIMIVLGKKESLKRIEEGLKKLLVN